MDIEAAILDLLAARDPDKSICPSEVARELGDEDSWRDLMPDVRAAAGRLAGQGIVVITQGDKEVDLASVKGPIRIRRGPDWTAG